MLLDLDFNESDGEPVFLCLAVGFSKAQEFVVMHGHSCLSGLVIDGGMGGGHKEEEEYMYECWWV